MRSVIAFDTLAFVRELKESGMDTKEAEGIAKALMTALSQLMETKEIATRQDTLELRQEIHTTKIELEQKISYIHSELKEQIYDVRAELKEEITSVKTELKVEVTANKIDLKTELSSTKAELKEDIFNLKDALKNQELHLKSFIVRCFTTAIVLIGGLQTIIHLCSKS